MNEAPAAQLRRVGRTVRLTGEGKRLHDAVRAGLNQQAGSLETALLRTSRFRSGPRSNEVTS
jgi:hypothetical protein